MTNSDTSVEEGIAQPFDRRYSGFCFGQASGCLILEVAESATQRGIALLTKIAAGSIVLDANRMTNPSFSGECQIMRNVLQQAGLNPEDIDYVNAHGTGTLLGDEVESHAINAIFAPTGKIPKVNSTKSLLGHCLFSAGLVEAIATVVQMTGGFLHANPYLEDRVNNDCHYVGKNTEPFEIQHAINNSFGFAGINSSLIISRSSR
ncbi:hypothetical protein ABLA30_14805 [Xenorhabdus nematophila]|uniref:hypothetical protein n=1 Tax=Xenorhabdus nematophila TaxID=628 RepID=UPI0032B83571